MSDQNGSHSIDGNFKQEAAALPTATTAPVGAPLPHAGASPEHRDRKQRKHRSHSRSKSRSRSRSRSRHSRSKRRSRSRRHDRRSASASPRSRRHRRSRRYSRERFPHRGGPRSPRFNRSPRPHDPLAEAEKKMRDEKERLERDERTVFVSKIHFKIKEKELFEFFTRAGKIRDIQLIKDPRTKKSKGLGYIEFWDKTGALTALSMNGEILAGCPIEVARTQSEKNRAAAVAAAAATTTTTYDESASRLQVTNLHPQVVEEDLRDVFSPFGVVNSIEISRDSMTGESRGFGIVQYNRAGDAKFALSKLDGLDVRGQPIRVRVADGRQGQQQELNAGVGHLGELDDEGGGLALTMHSRMLLMETLSRNNPIVAPVKKPAPVPVPAAAFPLPTQSMVQPSTCIVLKNMFSPDEETDPDFDFAIKEDVEEECKQFGEIRHIFVDKTSKLGVVFLRCGTIETAHAIINALNGRWFASRQISAEFMNEAIYQAKFRQS